MWQELPRSCKRYLLFIYALGALATGLCFRKPLTFDVAWVLLAVASFSVATINLRLGKNPSVLVSMGDVFTLLVLLHFGVGPALIAYWANVTAAALIGYAKAYGLKFFGRVRYHRLVFNLACCSICVFVMGWTQDWATQWVAGTTLRPIVTIATIALAWFVVNTGTVAMAIALMSNRPFVTVWTDGIGISLMNFLASGATAGLVSLYYAKAALPIIIFSVPIAIILYHVYLFYIQRAQQAEAHFKKLNGVFLQTIEAMAMSVDAKDRYTHGHIRRVQVFAEELAKCCGISDENQLMALKAGALLHDIGKIAIPEYILNKPTVLTAGEFEKMKLHPIVGANILKNIEFPYPVIPAVRSHHERWDGRGYPDGLKGEEIPLIARILSLVDCYDALTTDRPYRSPMKRSELEEFFTREAGKAYDPHLVETFLKNLDRLEAAEKAAELPSQDIWGIRAESKEERPSVRPLERVQPTISYQNALRVDSRIQREIYSVFEFTQADIHGLDRSDVLYFMGRKLQNVLTFDAGAFFLADLDSGEVIAERTVGPSGAILEGVRLRLEQKLTGWVAANNQALSNLPPFPDFLSYPEIGTKFALSAIAPMNSSGTVVGAISLYRFDNTKFTEEEFRRLELLASQTAIALSRLRSTAGDEPVLFDNPTGLPNAFQLHLMFDQVSIDAKRYEYPLALLTIQAENSAKGRRRFGLTTIQDAVNFAAGILRGELRDTDLLTRCGPHEFVVLSPGTTREQAEALKSRVQDVLDRSPYKINSESQVSVRASVGVAVFPEDGTSLRDLLSCAENRLTEDRELRAAARQRVRKILPELSLSK
jgi:diguanylate cyclase (GGDEF)-like protein/putative nucleotidyltransferase with HDIG domain